MQSYSEKKGGHLRQHIGAFTQKNLIALLIVLGLTLPAVEASAPRFELPFEADCLALAAEAEVRNQIPSGLLQSIALVESGRQASDGTAYSWPWTIRHGQKGLFFDDKAQAQTFLARHDDDLMMDVGCMQISRKWHQNRFRDKDQMLDPLSNVTFAASFLIHLYEVHGDWEQAARHYHTSDKVRNQKYWNKIAKVWQDSEEMLWGGEPTDLTQIAALDRIMPEEMTEELPDEMPAARPVVMEKTDAKTQILNPKTLDMIVPAKPAPLALQASTVKPEPQKLETYIKSVQPRLAGKMTEIEKFRDLFAKK